MFKVKFKAFFLHLSVSFIVIMSLLLFVFLYWYPDALADISGLKYIVIIMVIIDLVLGPLLTFILYKPKKSGLVFDIVMIGIFQIGALAYATYTIYQGHPVFVTYAADRFIMVAANEVNPEKAIYKEFKKSRLEGPTIAYAKQPDDSTEAAKIVLEVLSGAPDIDKRPELYEPVNKHLNDIFARSIDPNKLLNNKLTREEFMKFVNKHRGYEKFALLPLSGQEKDVIWALNRKTGKPVDVININPWAMAVNTH